MHMKANFCQVADDTIMKESWDDIFVPIIKSGSEDISELDNETLDDLVAEQRRRIPDEDLWEEEAAIADQAQRFAQEAEAALRLIMKVEALHGADDDSVCDSEASADSSYFCNSEANGDLSYVSEVPKRTHQLYGDRVALGTVDISADELSKLKERLKKAAKTNHEARDDLLLTLDALPKRCSMKLGRFFKRESSRNLMSNDSSDSGTAGLIKRISFEANRRAVQEWAARVLEEERKAQQAALNQGDNGIAPEGWRKESGEDADESWEEDSSKSADDDDSMTEEQEEETAMVNRRASTGQLGFLESEILCEEPEERDDHFMVSRRASTGRIADATSGVFDELRTEIRKVKFPTEKKKTVTIIMPDGKKVKQVKEEDEELSPVSLTLEGSTRKGDVYVRADGKRVRLVKRKEKRRKEKLEKKRMKEEAKRLRKEADVRWEHEQQQQQARKSLIQCDWGDMSWQEAEEMQELILQEAWQGNRATESDQGKRNRFLSSKRMYEHEAELLEPEAGKARREVESDEDSFAPERLMAADAETSSRGTDEDKSTSTLGSHQPTQHDVALSNPALQKFKGLRDSVSTFGTVSMEQDEEEEEEALRQFYASLELEEEEDFPKSVRLPSLKRMSLKSMEQLDNANRMKRISHYAGTLGDLQAQRLRFVGMPKHATQSPTLCSRSS